MTVRVPTICWNIRCSIGLNLLSRTIPILSGLKDISTISYCVKFFDKANMSSDNKFSLRTSTFEPRTIVFTVLNIMFDVLQRDSNASFFFIGAEDERDLPGKATRRFRFYSNLVLSAISDKIFEHFRTDHLSLYVLVNKWYVKDMTDYVKRINNYVEQAMFE